MPINNELPNLQSPVKNRRGEFPLMGYLKQLENINVQLLSCPTKEHLMSYIPRWCDATWNDVPHNSYLKNEREEFLQDMFDGNVLPSAMETVQFVFLISNIDLIDVTHLLRHRTMSFSAVCSADRDMRHDTCLVKESIRLHPEFFKKYKQIVKFSKALYADMVDSEEVSILDARTVLPRCLEHHYYCRVNLKDAIHFVKQRLDRQIQPESDNIVALRMWIEMVKRFPMMKKLIDLDSPDLWYVHTAPTGRSSNIYMPEIPRNDVFEYKKQWFLYKKQRSEFPGGPYFQKIWDKLVKELHSL